MMEAIFISFFKVTWFDSPKWRDDVFSPQMVTEMGPLTRSRLEEPGRFFFFAGVIKLPCCIF